MKLTELKVTTDDGVSTQTVSETDYKVAPVFNKIREQLVKNGADLVRKMGNVFCFRVTNSGGQEGIWILDAKHGNGSVTFGGSANGDLTFTIADEDLVDLLTGKTGHQALYFRKKLKLKGDTGIVMQLRQLLPNPGAKIAGGKKYPGLPESKL